MRWQILSSKSTICNLTTLEAISWTLWHSVNIVCAKRNMEEQNNVFRQRGKKSRRNCARKRSGWFSSTEYAALYKLTRHRRYFHKPRIMNQAVSIVHRRFKTPTFHPSPPLADPAYISCNCVINAMTGLISEMSHSNYSQAFIRRAKQSMVALQVGRASRKPLVVWNMTFVSIDRLVWICWQDSLFVFSW